MKALLKRKGNFGGKMPKRKLYPCLNESPSEKEGKYRDNSADDGHDGAGLNESPSEKEGKFFRSVEKPTAPRLPQ